ncbi:hypothetical protein LOZ58_001085 [Ophidiomyces ophidiicola]|nr:hypothetical protein LOZ58_001085 [Ophidiomyces ophidiicola]
MPLHLLGKKSWNVYNKDNIARVRRDEALAKAKGEADERREQEIDAERRIALLRGQRRSPSPPSHNGRPNQESSSRISESRHRKRRRLVGEDDTDRDIRLAKEDALLQTNATTKRTIYKSVNDTPLTGASGHINLFPDKYSQQSKKNLEVEEEASKKKKEYEDQYTMRFSNAAGYKQGMERPWYSTSNQDIAAQSQDIPSKDVWGNEDPRRREREKTRMDMNDPLAAMKKGVRQLRDVENCRKRWNEERRRELDALELDESQSEQNRRRSHSHYALEGFILDENPAYPDRRKKRHSRRYHREESRSSQPHYHGQKSSKNRGRD